MLKFFILRFDLLLAQYLYKNKKLNLPGIGRFEADNSIYPLEENDKQRSSLEGITFYDVTVAKADDELIDFIKEQTGKMKPLAISDLESYLTLGKQFLYIGKPFYLEGIGTLQLKKNGRFEFLPGEYITTKLEDPNIERSEGKKRSVHEEDRAQKESNNNTVKIIMLFIGIIALLALVGWGGYYFYNMYANEQETSVLNDSTAIQQDSAYSALSTDSVRSAAQLLKDSIATENASATRRPGYVKFIVEITDDKLRASNRYKDLRSYGNKIQFETTDSINYKLFYILRATPADTARIRDSLNRWYYRDNSVNRVVIEP